MRRQGMGKGLGMGYKNIAPMDSHIHSLSAKGFSLNNMIYDDKGKNVWVRAKGTPICTCEDYPCCGHSEEQRRMTQKEWDDMINHKVRRAMDYDDYDDELYAKGELEEAYKYYSDDELKDLYFDANSKEKKRINLELKRRLRKKEPLSNYDFWAKGSLVAPKQPKTVYHKGMYSKDADEKNLIAMKEKSTRIKKEISNLLYEVNNYKGEDAKDHEMLTITVLRNKLPHFDFLTAHTDVEAVGYWKSKTTDVSYDKENNALLQIEFLDTKNEKVGKRLMRLFEDLNDVEVGEELLYVKTQPLEETSLPLEKWR